MHTTISISKNTLFSYPVLSAGQFLFAESTHVSRIL